MQACAPTSRRSPTSDRRRTLVQPALVLIAVFGALLLSVDAATAESAWIRGEIRLNVRTGPGTQFRILGGVKTGDRVEIEQRAEGWTKVGLDSGSSGWIPVGYLESEPPPALKLEQIEKEVAQLRQASKASTSEVADLKETKETFTLQDREQRLEIDQLRRENLRLKAGARWPEWITGAIIVSVGMIVGAILQRSSGRRSSSRIRL